MKPEYEYALAEVSETFSFMSEDDYNKMPKGFIDLVNNVSAKCGNYKKHLSPRIPLQEQVTYETKAILSCMYRAFWTDQETQLRLEKEDKEELVIGMLVKFFDWTLNWR